MDNVPQVIALPRWARRELYEYDLGMTQHCNHCMAPLCEGAVVWRDIHTHKPVERYCSVRCVLMMDGLEEMEVANG